MFESHLSCALCHHPNSSFYHIRDCHSIRNYQSSNTTVTFTATILFTTSSAIYVQNATTSTNTSSATDIKGIIALRMTTKSGSETTKLPYSSTHPDAEHTFDTTESPCYYDEKFYTINPETIELTYTTLQPASTTIHYHNFLNYIALFHSIIIPFLSKIITMAFKKTPKKRQVRL